MMKIKGAGWFAMAAVGAEMAAVGRRMEKQQKLARTVAPPKEEVREQNQYKYHMNERAVESLGDAIASLLEIVVVSGVSVPSEVMFEARSGLEFLESMRDKGGTNKYVFGSHNIVEVS